MDAATQAFVNEIVSRKIAENWLYWLLFLAASFLAAFAGAYIKRRAENLATRDDFNELKQQLQQTTRLTEEIKTEIGHQEWRAREANSLRRTALEKLIRTAGIALESAFPHARDLSIGEFPGKFNEEPLIEVEILAALYFPSLRDAATEFTLSIRHLLAWGYERNRQIRPMTIEERQAAFAEGVRQITECHQAVILKRNALIGAAIIVMEGLLDPH